MNKKTIITILFALVAVAGQAQNQVVWENPSAFMGASNATLDITKVELKQTETVMHLIVIFRPGYEVRDCEVINAIQDPPLRVLN